MINCQFISNSCSHYLLMFSSTSNGSVQFINCQFITNSVDFNSKLIKLHKNINVEFNRCDFFNTSGAHVIEIKGKETNPASITIKDTNYSFIKTYYDSYSKCVILLSHATLILEDSVSFYYIINFDSVICLVGNSKITISGTVKFKYNRVLAIIDMDADNMQSQYIMIKENSVFKISDNEVDTFFHKIQSKMYRSQPYCIFQYFTFSTNKMKMEPKTF